MGLKIWSCPFLQVVPDPMTQQIGGKFVPSAIPTFICRKRVPGRQSTKFRSGHKPPTSRDCRLMNQEPATARHSAGCPYTRNPERSTLKSLGPPDTKARQAARETEGTCGGAGLRRHKIDRVRKKVRAGFLVQP